MNNEVLNIKTLKELYKMNFPPTKWLVEKLIPEDAITILSAPPSSFKTWLILEIAGKMSKGEKLFGKYGTEKAGVLLLDEESGERQLSERFKKLGISESIISAIKACLEGNWTLIILKNWSFIVRCTKLV